MAKVIPLALMPDLYSPYSAQSGVNVKARTPMIPRGMARSINAIVKRMKLFFVGRIAKERTMEAITEILKSLVLSIFLMIFGTRSAIKSYGTCDKRSESIIENIIGCDKVESSVGLST